MKTHDLKCWPEFFTPLAQGLKTFEVRVNDREYAVGDLLKLREWSPSLKQYTGPVTFRRVSYVMTNSTFVPSGYIIMGLVKPSNPVNPRVLCDQVAGIIASYDDDGEGKYWDRAAEAIIAHVLKEIH